MQFPELYHIARHNDASVRELMSHTESGLHWDVGFYREAHDWELESINTFMELLYLVPIR